MASTRPPQHTYTAQKLHHAVARSTDLAEVLTHLGLPDNPKRRRYAAERIKALGIDATHLHTAATLYSDAQLTEAVAASHTMVQVATRLGAKPVGGTLHHLKRRITELGLDTAHFAHRQPKQPLRPHPTSEGFQRVGRKLVVNETMLRAAVPRSTSIAEVIRRLGLEPSGPRHRAVREEIHRLGLDTGHFLGQGHRLGAASGTRLPPDKVLIFRPEQRYRRHSERVRIALLDLGVPERCAMCGTGSDWHGRRMSLEIDHINADFRDNRRENLRFLCPNCHATTMSFCRKKGLG